MRRRRFLGAAAVTGGTLLLEPRAAEPFFVSDSLQATRPDWSWSRTAFESNRNDPAKQIYQIFTLDADDAALAASSPHPLAAQHAKWSPDAHQVVFAVGYPIGGGGVALVTNP